MKYENNCNFSVIQSAQDIRNNIQSFSNNSGVYVHYIDREGLTLLSGVQPTTWGKSGNKKIGLVYIGKARDMQERMQWHLGFINVSHSCICHGTLSTLRHSYMANITNISCLSQQDDLNAFMDNHVYIKYCLTDQYEQIEDSMIKRYSPPLNIQGNDNPFIATNKKRRKAIKDAYRAKFKC